MDESLFKTLMLGSNLSSFLGELLILVATLVTVIRCTRRRVRPGAAWSLCGAFGAYFLLGAVLKILFLARNGVLGEPAWALVTRSLGDTVLAIFHVVLDTAGLLCRAGFGVALLLLRPLPPPSPSGEVSHV